MDGCKGLILVFILAFVLSSVGVIADTSIQLLGDSVEIGTPTDLLELNETIGDVREILTENDLSALQHTSINTINGVVTENQFIKFNKTDSSSNLAVFGQDLYSNVGHFFKIKKNNIVFDWIAEFNNGFSSKIDVLGNNTYRLSDLEGAKIAVFSKNHTIVSAQLDTTYFDYSHNNQISLKLMGGDIDDTFREGDKKTYNINGNNYEVELVIISSSEAIFKVNGETLPRLRNGEIEQTASGLKFGIGSILISVANPQNSLVNFYLGASKIELKDFNFNNDEFAIRSDQFIPPNSPPVVAIVDNEEIARANVKIAGTYDLNVGTAVLDSITYRFHADSDMYVPPGHGVREYLTQPGSMLVPSWDIRYEGLIDTGVTTIKFNPIGRDEYKLQFTNQEGLNYVVPFLTARDTGIQGIRYGDFVSGVHRNLVWFEGRSQDQHSVRLNDFFILSDISGSGVQDIQGGNSGLGPGNANLNVSVNISDNSTSAAKFPQFASSQTDNTAFTRVLKYESIDVNNKVLTFTDLSTGTKQVSYDASGNANIVIGGITYAIELQENPSLDLANLSIDLNGDGFRFNGSAVIATEGGALIALGSFNNSFKGDNPPFFGDMLVGDSVNISINTLSKQYDESGSNTFTGIPFEYRNVNNIGINKLGIKGTPGFGVQGGDLKFLTSEPEIAQALDKYGAFYELFDPLTTNTPEELTIEYPLSQRGVQVFVTSGPITTVTVNNNTNNNTAPPGDLNANITASPISIRSVSSVGRNVANNNLQDGINYEFSVSLPVNESNVTLWLDDWKDSSGHVIATAGNTFVLYGGSQYVVGSSHDYNASESFTVADDNPSDEGIQATFNVLVRVPRSSVPGAYSTFFGIRSLRPGE